MNVPVLCCTIHVLSKIVVNSTESDRNTRHVKSVALRIHEFYQLLEVGIR